MKKITAKILAALMAVLMLASVVGCAPAEPVVYDTGAGLTITLPAGMEEVEVADMVKVYANNKVVCSISNESASELAAALEVESVTLEEYAELYSLVNGYEAFTADANGNLVTTYVEEVEGENWFYYVTLRADAENFWAINLACREADQATFADQFTAWNATITVA